MTGFRERAGDNIHWMEHMLRTDIGYQTEQGNAYTASDRFTINAGATEYIEFRIPVGTKVRIYNRFTSVSGDDFEIDLCSVTSITPGGTEFAHTNMNVGRPGPSSRVWRGATAPVGLVVQEYSFLPSAATGNTSGAIADQSAYRIIEGSTVPPILRVTDTGAASQTFNIIVLFTERADEDN